MLSSSRVSSPPPQSAVLVRKPASTTSTSSSCKLRKSHCIFIFFLLLSIYVVATLHVLQQVENIGDDDQRPTTTTNQKSQSFFGGFEGIDDGVKNNYHNIWNSFVNNQVINTQEEEEEEDSPRHHHHLNVKFQPPTTNLKVVSKPIINVGLPSTDSNMLLLYSFFDCNGFKTQHKFCCEKEEQSTTTTTGKKIFSNPKNELIRIQQQQQQRKQQQIRQKRNQQMLMSHCLLHNLFKNSLSIFRKCGEDYYDVYIQLDGTRHIPNKISRGGIIIYQTLLDNGTIIQQTSTRNIRPRRLIPQHHYLDYIHTRFPNSTFLLPKFHSTTSTTKDYWINSLLQEENEYLAYSIVWEFYEQHTTKVPLPPPFTGEYYQLPKALEYIYEYHNHKIREFVTKYPSHKLIEIDLDDSSSSSSSTNTGRVLANSLGIQEENGASCWDPSTVNTTSLQESRTNPLYEFTVDIPKFKSPSQLKLPKPIINVGFPKAGTSTIFDFFRCNGLKTQHWYCCEEQDHSKVTVFGTNKLMSRCILDNLAYAANDLNNIDSSSSSSNISIFDGCGDYEVYTEINGPRGFQQFDFRTLMDNGSLANKQVSAWHPRMILPQHHYLMDIHQAYPNATFILNTRPAKDWIDSVMKWGTDLKKAIPNEFYFQQQHPRWQQQKRNQKHGNHSFYSNLTIPTWWESSPNRKDIPKILDYINKFHNQHIRNFVQQYPSHTLIEIDITRRETPYILADKFGLNETCWGHANENIRKRNIREVMERQQVENSRRRTMMILGLFLMILPTILYVSFFFKTKKKLKRRSKSDNRIKR